jgi:DNA-binding winged helix-turn-helix (wHTH) protein/tetratricopeptide (TPR) repeat protein
MASVRAALCYRPRRRSAGGCVLQTTTISLAQEPDFRLGGVDVSPSRGVISDGAVEHRVRPQVMQALLMLLHSEGRTVTRDELADACWDGRVVSDDAINRVIALLRGLARQFDPPSFELHTIPKVGFRLDTAGPREAGQVPSLPVDGSLGGPTAPEERTTPRRRVLLGAAGMALLAGAGGAWWVETRRLPARAGAAMEAGMAAFRQSTPDQMTQAIAAFQRAAALAPRHADGWAWLALAYQYQSRLGAPADKAGVMAQRTREAARRALAIDPDNAEAQVALVGVLPTADWVHARAALESLLARYPRNFSANFMAAVFYGSTGQLEIAIRRAQAAVTSDAAWPKLFALLIQSDWCAGRLNEADDWMARGLSQWPRHGSLWFLRHRLLTYTGRAAEALAMVDDVDNRPIGIPEWTFEVYRLESRALLTHAPADIAAAVVSYRAIVPRGVGFAQNAMQFLSTTGRLDEAFVLLDTMFFDRGQRLGALRYSLEQGEYDPRHGPDPDTGILWMPALAAMRADPRMLPVIRAVGLADYWRSTGSRPITAIAGI